MRKPRERPTTAMFQRSEAPFFAVLKRLRPDAVLVLGERLWNSMPDGECGPKLLGERRAYWFRVDGQRRVLAARIHHPASIGFSPRNWHATVENFLDFCRPKKASSSPETFRG
jgi:hypothetical protein